MPAWSLLTGGSPTPATVAEWFSARFVRARALLPAANFDTIIPVDFDETITTELVDQVGTADASAIDSGASGGVVAMTVGDDVTELSQARLQKTGSGAHVKLLTDPWYAAALGKYIQPLDATQAGDTEADMIALWGDDQNRVTLGVLGNASGGSATKWVGRVDNDASNTTTLGPDLDPEESPVWHLFEMWTDGAAGAVHFAIDGTEFAGTISGADLPGFAAKLGPILQRTATGDAAAVWWDKMVVVVKSPTVGEA